MFFLDYKTHIASKRLNQYKKDLIESSTLMKYVVLVIVFILLL